MVKRLGISAVLAISATLAIASTSVAVPGAFSEMKAGTSFEDSWKVTVLRDQKPSEFRLVSEDNRIVMRTDAEGSAGSLARAFSWKADTGATLNWSWKINRVVQSSDMSRRDGDDYAARLYVMFDYPLERLPLWERTMIQLLRWWYGDEVPAAAICYVWANREEPGSSAWNVYSDRVRMIVLRNADSDVGNWVEERRNPYDDFRMAFGEAPPPVSGLALAADTDQTGESVTAWFGDISLSR